MGTAALGCPVERSSTASAAGTTTAALTYENIFRIIIMQFIDAHSFDVRSVKKTCVHIVHPDGRLIPFDTYNLFYAITWNERAWPGCDKTRNSPVAAM